MGGQDLELEKAARRVGFGGAAGVCLLAAGLGLQGTAAMAQTLGVQVTCTGSVPNGWTFAADALDGRFLHVIWTGPQAQTRVSVLTYYATNADGAPVFNGALQDAIAITLVDGSGGTPATGSEVAIYASEWGWMTGTCRQLGGATPDGLLSTEVIRQNLLGTRDAAGTNWLRRNGFALARVVSLAADGKTELWQQDASYPVNVIFAGGRIVDVISVAE
jgi:hypothetical protein